MRSLFRRLTKSFFVLLNVGIALLFILACCVPYLNPAKWWWIGFISLATPYLAIVLFFFIVFWLLVKPKLVFLSIVTLLIGWNQLQLIFATNIHSGFSDKKDSTYIRLVDWNVASMAGVSKTKEKRVHARRDIADVILNVRPDIICLQEFNHSTDTAKANNIGMFAKQYPYYYFSKDIVEGDYQSGCIIFSKYKIINSGKIKFPDVEAESLTYIDLLKGADTLRIFTVHLQSFKFAAEDYVNIDNISNKHDSLSLHASKGTLRKMKYAFTRRGAQADIVRSVLDTCPYPSIICGDFNDVPNSYVYQHIRNQRQDAFLEKDYGVGRSFTGLAPTLRIDYILPDNNFNVHQFEMVDEDLSDHLMLVTDVSLRK